MNITKELEHVPVGFEMRDGQPHCPTQEEAQELVLANFVSHIELPGFLRCEVSYLFPHAPHMNVHSRGISGSYATFPLLDRMFTLAEERGIVFEDGIGTRRPSEQEAAEAAQG